MNTNLCVYTKMIFFRLTILVVEAGMLISFTCERNPFMNVYLSMRS